MTTIVGVEPNLMGIGPAFAIPKVLQRAGISKDDVDLYELNEGRLCWGSVHLARDARDENARTSANAQLSAAYSFRIPGGHVDRAHWPRHQEGQPERWRHRSRCTSQNHCILAVCVKFYFADDSSCCSSCAYSTRSAALCVPFPLLFDPLYTISRADEALLLLATQQGARQIATALSEAKRSGARIICTSMCIGSGMGAASLIVAEN